MFRLITLIALLSVIAWTNAYSQGDVRKSTNQVVVVKTMIGDEVKGLLWDVTDSSVTVMKRGKEASYQFIEVQSIKWIKYRKKRSALANSALVLGAVAAAGLSTAAWTSKPLGATEITSGNAVVGVATAATSLFLISRVISGFPRTLKVYGRPAVLKENKYRFLLN